MQPDFATRTPIAASPAPQSVLSGWISRQGANYTGDAVFVSLASYADQPGVALFIQETDEPAQTQANNGGALQTTNQNIRTIALLSNPVPLQVNVIQATVHRLYYRVGYLNAGSAQTVFSLQANSSASPFFQTDQQGNLLVNIAAQQAGVALPSTTIDPSAANLPIPFNEWLQLEREILIECRKLNMLVVWLKQGMAEACPVQIVEPGERLSNG